MIRKLGILAFLLVAFASSHATAACLATGKPCSQDLQCCPGMVCGWGSVCQTGCKINGVFYPNNTVNPNNACQVCSSSINRNQWTNRAAGTACGSQSDSTCNHPDTCNSAGQCLTNFAPNGTTCSDGSACTQTDSCQAGACVGANPVVCTAQDQCHVAGTCNPSNGACSNPARPDATACNDGNACTQTDQCTSGACIGSNPVVCTAHDQCHTAGTCNPGTGNCSNPSSPDLTPCNDGNACTQLDSCDAGICVGELPVLCPPPGQCFTDGVCNGSSGECEYGYRSTSTSCDDGDACTSGDHCVAGDCEGTSQVVCTPLSQCHDAGTCNPATGDCTDPVRPDGSSCDDADTCSQVDVCDTGVCGLCIEDPAASPRFVDNGDGTITDRWTCLVWEKKTGFGLLSDVHGVSNRFDFYSAESVFLPILNVNEQFAGHSDWRLPYTAGSPALGASLPAEIESILIPNCATPPCIDPAFGPTASANYWTSVLIGSAFAYSGRFGVGDVILDDVTDANAVRAVRGGHCDNVQQDECESGVDCGAGSGCLLCEGEACTTNEECKLGSCYNDTCAPQPSCSDGVRNGDETDVDCGGSCAGCSDGGACNTGTDCFSGLCDFGTCSSCLSDTAGCSTGTECCNGYCDAGSCSYCLGSSESCDFDSDCCDGYCTFGSCGSCRDYADGCTTDEECCDGYCSFGSCSTCLDNGELCDGPSDCCSGVCDAGECSDTFSHLPGNESDDVRKHNAPPRKIEAPTN